MHHVEASDNESNKTKSVTNKELGLNMLSTKKDLRTHLCVAYG